MMEQKIDIIEGEELSSLKSEVHDMLKKGLDSDEMEIYITEPEHTKLLRDSGMSYTAVYDTKIEKVMDVPVFLDNDSGARIEYMPSSCNNCEMDKIHHDRKAKWLCPWCEL